MPLLVIKLCIRERVPKIQYINHSTNASYYSQSHQCQNHNLTCLLCFIRVRVWNVWINRIWNIWINRIWCKTDIGKRENQKQRYKNLYAFFHFILPDLKSLLNSFNIKSIKCHCLMLRSRVFLLARPVIANKRLQVLRAAEFRTDFKPGILS